MESFTGMPVPTLEGSFLSSVSNPRRDDGDGRDDIFGGTPGVKNIVTIDTIVTHPTHPRPHDEIRIVHRGQA